MIDLGAIAFLRPLWGLALPAFLLLAYVGAKQANGFSRWRAVIDPQLLPALMQLGHVDLGARDKRPWIMGIAGAIMAIGLAGPALRNTNAPVFRNLDAIMILLDLSPSMVQGGNLENAQASVARLLDRTGTRPVALAVFAGESFLISVPTQEPQILKSSIAVIDAQTMPVAGSRPDRALALARNTLHTAKAENADVILITDGGGLGPDAYYQAQALAREGMRVSGVFVTHRNPPYGTPPPQKDRLQELARAGEGIVVAANDLSALEQLLSARRHPGSKEKARLALLYHDYGPWVFFAGLLVLLPIYRQRREV